MQNNFNFLFVLEIKITACYEAVQQDGHVIILYQ